MSNIWIPESPSQLLFLPKPLDFLRGILPDLFKIILSNPSSLPTNTGDEKQHQRLLEVHEQRQQQLIRAWTFLSQQSLPQYICIIGQFPDPLLPVLLSDPKEKQIILILQHAYQGIQQWLFDLTGCKEPRPLYWQPPENYKPWAELFVAHLKLATAVYHHEKSQDLRQLFTSPEHLWFWTQVAICRRNLKGSGLGSPLPHTEVLTKADSMKRWIKDNQMRQSFEETLEKGSRLVDQVDFFEKFDWFLEAEAMRIAEEEAKWNKKGGAWLEYRNAQKHTRNQVRHQKDLQAVYLYQFPNDTETHMHTTGLHQKRPKSPKQSKKGFAQK
jgi:hypothetical protein